MNIIFGRDHAEKLKDNYTLLELDTIGWPTGQEITAFCAVEDIPIPKMPSVASMKDLHANLVTNYQKQDWNYCEQALEHLIGFWNSDMDSYYENLKQRIADNKDKELTGEWWVVRKTPE